MDNFSHIIKKYKIKCYDELFKKIIIEKFENIKNIEENSSETLFIGITYKIKIIDKINILILGYELDNKKILDYFLRNKNRINFFSLSKLSSDYYLKKFDIHSTIIHFDFNNKYEKTKKLVYFNKKDNIEFENHSNNFINFIKETDNICNIIQLKLIIFEEIFYIWDPYINILYESYFECIKIINFYQLNSKIYMKKFIDLPNNIMNKYLFLKKNLQYIKNFIEFICKIPNQIKYLYSVKKYENLNCECENIDKSYVIISDDLNYLESIIKMDICKIFISKENICLMKNNIVHIHENFFLNIVSNEHKECKNINFIIENKKDIIFLQDYLVFYKKYFPNKNIKIYANTNLKINNSLDINSFVVEENTKIFFPFEYKFDQYLNDLILIKNIEISVLDKINVLVASTQYPSYGGAATNAYNIIRYLQNKNIENKKIFGMFINDVIDNNIINPDNLDNISGISYKNMNDKNIYYNFYKKYGLSPDIAFCKNCMAPKIIKKIFPNAAIIFLVSGIMGFSEINCGANEIVNYDYIQKKQEKDAILVSEIVLCNSQLTLDYYKKIYYDVIEKKNNLANNPFDTTKYNTIHFNSNNSNNTKKFDIIVVASNVNRKVKNIGFIQELLNFSEKLRNYKIVIIGDNSDKMFSNFLQVKILPLQKQEEVDFYLEQSKIILIPSLFDSNSNTFREAVMLDVIPIISINVAHPSNYPEYFVIKNYKYEDWENRIIYVLDNFNNLRKNYDLKKCFENNDQIESFL
jgi:glycosyltransferase involved in cell wall biosynthesis